MAAHKVLSHFSVRDQANRKWSKNLPESCPLYRHAISSVSSVGSVAMFFSLHSLVCPLYICLSGSFLSSRVRAVWDERFDSFGFIQTIYLPRAAAQDEMVL